MAAMNWKEPVSLFIGRLSRECAVISWKLLGTRAHTPKRKRCAMNAVNAHAHTHAHTRHFFHSDLAKTHYKHN